MTYEKKFNLVRPIHGLFESLKTYEQPPLYS